VTVSRSTFRNGPADDGTPVEAASGQFANVGLATGVGCTVGGGGTGVAIGFERDVVIARAIPVPATNAKITRRITPRRPGRRKRSAPRRVRAGVGTGCWSTFNRVRRRL
jgi:hypothetical protein